jgi:NDP-sugar pyrophosphorylase family protein
LKAIILAGGKGARLLPYTEYIPKPLVPIRDMPILEIILRQLISYGFDDITISVGHLAGLIEARFEDSDIKKEVELKYIKEEAPLGTAGSLSLLEGIGETFLVMNGDILTTLDYDKLVRFHKDSGNMLTIAGYKKSVNIDLGVMELDAKGQLKDYIEKPEKSFKVSMGIYIYEPAVLSYVKQKEYLDFPSLVKRLLAAGERVGAFPFEGYWLDIGRHDDYAKAVDEYDSIKDRLFRKR